LAPWREMMPLAKAQSRKGRMQLKSAIEYYISVDSSRSTSSSSSKRVFL